MLGQTINYHNILKMRHLKKVAYLLSMICLHSCTESQVKSPQQNAQNPDPVVNSLWGDGTGLFRGVNLAMSVSEVKASQKKQIPEEEEEDYLSYGFAYSDTLEGSYYFSFENGLEEIGIDIYREKNHDCKWLYGLLKIYLNTRFGSPSDENNLLVWHADKQGKEGAEITLADESAEYGYGKLTITIFPFESSVDPRDKDKPLSAIPGSSPPVAD